MKDRAFEEYDVLNDETLIDFDCSFLTSYDKNVNQDFELFSNQSDDERSKDESARENESSSVTKNSIFESKNGKRNRSNKRAQNQNNQNTSSNSVDPVLHQDDEEAHPPRKRLSRRKKKAGVEKEHDIIQMNQDQMNRTQLLDVREQALIDREERIRKVDESLLNKKQQLALKDQELMTRGRNLVARQQEFLLREQNLLTIDQWVKRKEKELIQKEQELIKKEQELREKEKIIAQQTDALNTREKVLHERESNEKLQSINSVNDEKPRLIQNEIDTIPMETSNDYEEQPPQTYYRYKPITAKPHIIEAALRDREQESNEKLQDINLVNGEKPRMIQNETDTIAMETSNDYEEQAPLKSYRYKPR